MHKEKEIKEQYEGESILSLTMRGVIVRDLDAGGKMPTSFDGYQLVYPNELLQCLFDIDVTPRCVGVVKQKGLVSPAYSRFVMHEEANAYYYDYLLRFMDDNKVLLHLSKNLRSSLTETDFGAINTCVPPLQEQQVIADFLDKKCAEIDQLVALQEKFIEELKAYKQSLITETVTKGLNPNAQMKDSGVLCIGKVPQDWNVKSLPFVFYNMDYLREPISAEQRSRKNPIYNYYGASGIIDKIDYFNVDDDVLLIGEDGANLKMRNLPLIYRAKGKFWVNNHAHVLKPIRDNIAYMQYMLEALDYNDFITGSAQPKLSQDNLAKVRVCVPPIFEQQAIADYLDSKCSENDQLITIKQKKIEELKEYKKSLIYEYVTGKKEVTL